MKILTCRGAAALLALVTVLSAAPWALASSAGAQEFPEAALTASARVQEGTYHEGMIRVSDGTHWGYADASGQLVIRPQFDQAEDFFLGAALVERDGKFGLLRWDGTFLLPLQYDALTSLGCGVYLGRRGSLWDLLSIAAVEGSSHQLYADQAAAALTAESPTQQLTLLAQDGTSTHLLVSALPQLLENRKVPGWQFPLSFSRKADFQDVSGRDWYDRWVNLAYSVGLMEGTGSGRFEPTRTLTVAEALRLAACLESRALRDDFHLQRVSGPLWYSSSVAYCEASGVISPGEFTQADFDRPVTRSEMARIVSATTPVRSMESCNSLTQVRAAIPDVSPSDYAAEAIYALYAKGILQGTDGSMTFRPADSLTRAEAAAIVSRIARPEQRVIL